MPSPMRYPPCWIWTSPPGPAPSAAPARVTPAVGSLFDAENQISAVIVLTNVTESRQMEAQRREFIANISHELKTPITSILGFTELMTSGVVYRSIPSQKAQYLERIGEEGRRMSNLIDDILRLSSLGIQTGRGGLGTGGSPGPV